MGMPKKTNSYNFYKFQIIPIYFGVEVFYLNSIRMIMTFSSFVLNWAKYLKKNFDLTRNFTDLYSMKQLLLGINAANKCDPTKEKWQQIWDALNWEKITRKSLRICMKTTAL